MDKVNDTGSMPHHC